MAPQPQQASSNGESQNLQQMEQQQQQQQQQRQPQSHMQQYQQLEEHRVDAIGPPSEQNPVVSFHYSLDACEPVVKYSNVIVATSA